MKKRTVEPDRDGTFRFKLQEGEAVSMSWYPRAGKWLLRIFLFLAIANAAAMIIDLISGQPRDAVTSGTAALAVGIAWWWLRRKTSVHITRKNDNATD